MINKRALGIGVTAVATAVLVSVAPPMATAAAPEISPVTNAAVGAAGAATATDSAVQSVQAAQAFPSEESTVVGSAGFIDDIQVGYFWSAARGDSVTETMDGPSRVKKAVLKLDVPLNSLISGAFADWTLSINGTDVGEFTIGSGQTGPLKKSFKFAKITGGEYTVQIRMTNEVASGAGSHTFRYAGDGQHSIKLKKKK